MDSFCVLRDTTLVHRGAGFCWRGVWVARLVNTLIVRRRGRSAPTPRPRLSCLSLVRSCKKPASRRQTLRLQPRYAQEALGRAPERILRPQDSVVVRSNPPELVGYALGCARLELSFFFIRANSSGSSWPGDRRQCDMSKPRRVHLAKSYKSDSLKPSSCLLRGRLEPLAFRRREDRSLSLKETRLPSPD